MMEIGNSRVRLTAAPVSAIAVTGSAKAKSRKLDLVAASPA
jgi:hypothetical protein